MKYSPDLDNIAIELSEKTKIDEESAFFHYPETMEEILNLTKVEMTTLRDVYLKTSIQLNMNPGNIVEDFVDELWREFRDNLDKGFNIMDIGSEVRESVLLANLLYIFLELAAEETSSMKVQTGYELTNDDDFVIFNIVNQVKMGEPHSTLHTSEYEDPEDVHTGIFRCGPTIGLRICSNFNDGYMIANLPLCNCVFSYILPESILNANSMKEIKEKYDPKEPLMLSVMYTYEMIGEETDEKIGQ